MKTVKMVVALNLIVFLTASWSGKAIAFDTELFSCPTAETLKKGEWNVGAKLWWGILPLTGYMKFGIASNVEVLGFVELGSAYYGLKIKCLEEKEKFPAVTVGLCKGFASEGISLCDPVDDYSINTLYLIFSKNFGNLKLNTGVGKGKNPYVLDGHLRGHYNLDSYFTYGSIEKKVRKAKIFLETNRFKEESVWVIGSSYKAKNFLFKLTGGIWSEKFFEIPKNKDYFLMPVLTIVYNKRKGD